ncbi:MAG TPA: hypothetical protein VMD55_12185 [Terracidiphilus sp.]|nr:hypothetical protein [Terracidiphilus sp.]
MHELSLDPEFRTERFRALRDTFPTHMNQIEAEQAMFSLWYREQRRRRRMGWMLRLWPVAAGLLLALFAPALCAFLARSHPWGMWLVFPFALLAHRPELEINDRMAHVLPQVILYAQFPLEGLVARMVLRSHVSIPGVTGQIFYFHFLAAVQLAMVSGILNPILIR